MRTHILLQSLIFLLPATAATMLFQVNDYITSPIQEFTWYRCGISGVAITYLLHSPLGGDNAASVATSLLYLIVTLSICAAIFKGSTTRVIILSVANLAVGMLGLMSGTFWMVAAMQ